MKPKSRTELASIVLVTLVFSFLVTSLAVDASKEDVVENSQPRIELVSMFVLLGMSFLVIAGIYVGVLSEFIPNKHRN